MKKLVLLLSLGMFMTLAGAQTTPEEYIESFFNKIEKGDFEGAIQSVPIGELMEDDTSFTESLLTKLENNAEKMGKYCGFELINKEETTPSFITFTYFIKYKNAPQRIIFVFYKPEEAWQVNRINIAGGSAARSNNRNVRQQQQSRFRM